MGITIKACAIALGIILANATASLASAPAPDLSSTVMLDSAGEKDCCKVCRKGKACGNSCIARNKTCHQPPGCACDG